MKNDKFIGGGVVDEEESLVAECFHGFEYVVYVVGLDLEG